MILSAYPGGLGATNESWLALIAALSEPPETADLAALLAPFVSSDPDLAVQYVEIPLGGAEAETILEFAESMD